MSAIRKIALSAAALFVGLSAMFMVTGTAVAADRGHTAVECDSDWHSPCP